MILDLRIYKLHNNKFAAWLKLYYLARSRELGAHQSQECRILKSTSFSPL